MIVLALTALEVNTALAMDHLLVHNLLNNAMSRLDAEVSRYDAYTRPNGAFHVFADHKDHLISYRAYPDNRVYVVITSFNDTSPMPALEVLVDNLKPKKHDYEILLQKAIV